MTVLITHLSRCENTNSISLLQRFLSTRHPTALHTPTEKLPSPVLPVTHILGHGAAISIPFGLKSTVPMDTQQTSTFLARQRGLTTGCSKNSKPGSTTSEYGHPTVISVTPSPVGLIVNMNHVRLTSTRTTQFLSYNSVSH